MRWNALLALTCAAATACAGLQIPRSHLRGWHVVEVGDVRIVGQGPPEAIAAVARDLAAFDAAFAHLLGRRIEGTGPTSIFLMSDPAFAERFHIGRGVEGWALPTLEGAFSGVALRPSSAQTRMVLYHEYTHLLLARGRNTPLPRWYNEGLADYFSTLALRDGALVVGSAPTYRLNLLVARGPMPLDRLFEVGSEMRGAEISDFYATSWALSHYLMSTPEGRRALSRFADQLALGSPVDEAREVAFARPLDQLSEELSTHVGYLRRRVAAEFVLDPSAVAPDEPTPPRPLGEGETARALGTLALALATDGESASFLGVARPLLEIAVAEDPSDARARGALARVRALGGDPSAAEAEIARALGEAPQDPVVLLRAGQVSLAAGDHGEAETRLRGALSRDPQSAAAWFGLGRALVLANRPDDALAALERARALGWSGDLDVEIARLHLENSRTEQAVALLWPLSQDPHGGHAAQQATELLREAGLEPPQP